MKFLIIAGAPTSLIDFRGHLISDLIAQGFDVHAAGPNLPVDSDIRQKLERKGAKVHDILLRRTGMNPVADIKLFLVLYRLMRRIQPDHVMGYTIKPVIFGTLAAALTRCPRRFALITGLGYAFSDHANGRKQRLTRLVATLLYRRSLQHAHKVFFQNPDDQALFIKHGILSSATPSAVVNGSGVDVEHYSPRPYPAKVTFLLIARLLIDKGVQEYAKAAYLLKEEYPDAHFLLVGDLDSNPNSITAQELDGWVQDGVIRYLGKQDDIREALGAASVFVLPTFYREGIPRTILEALAMGRPIITTDTPGCRETVIEGENGYLVRPRDVPELTDAMRVFIETPQFVATMGSRSREQALRKFDVRKVNAHMLQEMDVS